MKAAAQAPFAHGCNKKARPFSKWPCFFIAFGSDTVASIAGMLARFVFNCALYKRNLSAYALRFVHRLHVFDRIGGIGAVMMRAQLVRILLRQHCPANHHANVRNMFPQ